ncbi:MAG: hypothetical protein PHN82_03300 [bacterium]|nr:hypothetical protein [bacterium]
MVRSTRLRRLKIFLLAAFIFSAAAAIMRAEEPGYDSRGRRNPFVPPPKAEEEAAEPIQTVETEPIRQWFSNNLGGIVWDYQIPYALIGDRIVSVGDEIRGCLVIDITPGGLVIEYMRQRVDIPLLEEKKEPDQDDYF